MSIGVAAYQQKKRADRAIEKLAIILAWAESHPFTGMHDAPLSVRRALGYKGKGAKILQERLNRSSRSAPAEKETT